YVIASSGFFFSSRRRHTRCYRDWNSDVCSSDLVRGKTLTVARWIGRGTFKAAALIGAFVLIIALWLWDASILTRAADQNLQLIRSEERRVGKECRSSWSRCAYK